MSWFKNRLIKYFFFCGIGCFLGTFAFGSAFSQVTFKDQNEWMGIYFKGKKLGFSHIRLNNEGDRLRMQSHVYFRLKADGIEQVTSFTQETVLDTQLNPESFDLLQEVMGNRHHTLGRVDGKKLVLDVSSTGYKKEQTVDFRLGSAMSSTYSLNIRQAGLEVGKKGKFRVFMEALRTYSEVAYEIQGMQAIPYEGGMVETYVVFQKIGGMETTFWMTPEGVVLREVSQDGFESMKESKEKAQELGGEALSVSSLITLSLIKPQYEIQNPRTIKLLKVRLTNLHSADAIPQDQRQTVTRTEPMLGSEGYFASTLLVKTEPGLAFDPSLMASFPDQSLLKDTSEIQSEHEMIQALAKKIAKNEKDAWRIAQGINDWVFQNLEKLLVDTFTAVDALIQLKGECQSHTNLFVALARASGIPAQVVNGLVYSREYKGFVYHAWPEVFVGEWRAMDPTMGQYQVDATHIKLGEGSQDGPLRMMEFIGKLQIQILTH